MVLRAPAQPEADMLGYARDLKFAMSELLRQDAFGPGACMWKCPTHTPEGIGFWIGSVSGDNVEIHAYLALIPRLLGSLPVLEAKKGWTDEAWRRKGLGSALLREAAKAAPLQSDTDGMTDMAFAQWQAITGFKRRWWDAQGKCFVEESDVPSQDRLTPFENGRRWVIVLEL